MSVYRKFDRGDILFSAVHSRPRVSVAYDGASWRGTTGASASLSLYGGVRSRYDVKSSNFATSGISIYPLDELDTHSIDKVVMVSGSYPSTGSIRFIRCTNVSAPTVASITDTRWYDEHFSPIELLRGYYENKDTIYFSGSYDFTVPLFLGSNDYNFPGAYIEFSGALDSYSFSATSSFTIEALIKPANQHYNADRYIISTNKQLGLKFYVDSGMSLTASIGGQTFSSSVGSIQFGKWNHIALVVSGSNPGMTGTFYVNGTAQTAQSIIPTFSVATTIPREPSLIVGAFISSSVAATASMYSFNGMISETRFWDTSLTQTQILANISGTMINSSSVHLVHYGRYNDGPTGNRHGFGIGSGAFDYSPYAKHGRSMLYSANHIVQWTPSDHSTFSPLLTRVTASNDVRVIHIPSMFYGRQIDPGSIQIIDNVYNSGSIVRVLADDGRGSLYLSGSVTRDVTGEDYDGQKRRKVGHVFYTEGIIVISDPAMFDMMSTTVPFKSASSDLLSINFRGQTSTYVKTFNCRFGPASINASNNPTFSYLESYGTPETEDDKYLRTRDDSTVYVTAIGIYNEDRELVAIAKLAQPIRKRDVDKMNVRLRLDF